MTKCKHPFIDKMIVITQSDVPNTWLLGLGLKLHPRNKKDMFDKDLTQLMQSLFQVFHERSCWQTATFSSGEFKIIQFMNKGKKSRRLKWVYPTLNKDKKNIDNGNASENHHYFACTFKRQNNDKGSKQFPPSECQLEDLLHS